MKFFTDVSIAMRHTFITVLGMVNNLTYAAIMWLATAEDIQLMKERHNEQH